MNSATNFVLRVLMHLARGADLLDDGVAHHDDLVGERHGLLLRMRDHDEGDVQFALNLFQLDHHRLAQIEIERSQRLVEQQHGRPADQRARQRDALLLAAGKIARPPARERSVSPTISSISQTRRSRAALFHAFHFQAEFDVLEHRAMGKQRKALEHHRGVAQRRRQVGDVLAGDEDLALGRLFEAADHAQRRGLAAAGRPEHGDEFAVLQFGVEIDDRARSARIGLGNVFEDDVELAHVAGRFSPRISRLR